MTDSDNDDLALQALLSERADKSPDLDEHLLRQCYAIQKRHQFDDDRAQSLAAMERLIDAQIESQAGDGKEQD